jgi:MarR family transcriptional regulator, organic hydroperoxide resistance regulator
MKPKESICFNFKTSWHAIARMYNSMGEPEGLSASIGYVLLNIDEKKGTSASKLAPLIGMEATSLARMVKTLEERGYITREPDVTDKRSVRLFLTLEGLKKKEISRKTVKAFNKKVRDLVPQEKLDIFFEVVDEVNRIAENFNQED